MCKGKENRNRRSGFTLVEVVMVSLVIAIIATLALTPSDSQGGAQAQAAGRHLNSMITYGQHLAIARSDQAFSLRIDPAGGTVKLCNETAAGAVVVNPMTGEAMVLKVGAAAGATFPMVAIAGSNFGADNKVLFLSNGTLDQVEPAMVEFLSASSGRYTVMAVPELGVASVVTATMADVRENSDFFAADDGDDDDDDDDDDDIKKDDGGGKK